MKNHARFENELAKGMPILVDGGLATQLEAQGCNIGTDLWSAALLQTNPRAIVDAHRAYLDAGAACLISASYQASRDGFTALELSREAADQLIVSSIALAIQARDEFLRDKPHSSRVPLIAASVGPYGATLHDGSEYTGNYGVSAGGLREFHRPRLQILDKGGADLLACETIPSRHEAQALSDLLVDVECPAWISFSCRDDKHISDGTPIGQAARIFRDHPRVLAVGVNCTPPQFITPLIRQIKQAAPGKAVVVYPNSGETYDANDNSWSGIVTPIECAIAAKDWFEAGARLIGGCCRMGPSHITAMGESLQSVMFG